MAEDLRRIEAVLSLLAPGMTLAVDGNGTSLSLLPMQYVEKLSAYPIAWLEEPGAPAGLRSSSAACGGCTIPLATGENISLPMTRAICCVTAACVPDRDTLQVDVSLSYGIVEYRRILDIMAAQGWSRERCAPHAGHLLAFNVVAGLGLGLGETAMDESGLFGRLTAASARGRQDWRPFPMHPARAWRHLPLFARYSPRLLH